MNLSFRSIILANLLAITLVTLVPAQTPQVNFNRVRTYDVQHYVIRTSFDRQSGIVYGDTTIELKPLKSKFKSVELDSVGLKYGSVRLEPGNIELVSQTKVEKIIVNLDKEYSPKDLIKIRLIYSTKPKKGVYFVDESRKSGKVTRASQVWTQGQIAETRHWFPSYDFPDDKATTEQFITVENGETAIGNGEFKEITDNSNGTSTFHYYMPIPHSTYLTSFVIGTYERFDDYYGQIPLGFYVYPDRTEIVQRAFGKTKDMMRIFEELTNIKYPYNKYDQTIVAKFVFGGMENITASTMSDSEVFLANSASARSSVEDLVSHELAHSWFGNLVTCKNWAELWLNEGIATFMEAAYREKAYGREDYIRKIKQDVGEYMAEESYKKNPHGLFNRLADSQNDDAIFDTITYQKGGAVIHMLRETIGDRAFWIAINKYLETHKLGNVETQDLKHAMEEASKTDLTWFFSQWVYGGGYPKLNVHPVYDTKNRMLRIRFSQTQKSDNLVPNAFVLPIDLIIETASGIRNQKVTLRNREDVFTFDLHEKPSNIRIDENEKVPLKTVKLQKTEIK